MVEFVLFDIGGVLVELAGGRRLFELTGSKTCWQWFHSFEPNMDFERGRIAPIDFAQAVVSHWKMEISAAEFLAEFETWPSRLLPGARELMLELGRTVQTACLSNTNAVQWPRIRDVLAVGELFQHHFASHELGLAKPDAAVYGACLAATGWPAGKTLFVDDSASNVSVAREVGMLSEQVRGVDELRSLLDGYGLLVPRQS